MKNQPHILALAVYLGVMVAILATEFFIGQNVWVLVVFLAWAVIFPGAVAWAKKTVKVLARRCKSTGTGEV